MASLMAKRMVKMMAPSRVSRTEPLMVKRMVKKMAPLMASRTEL